MVRTVLTAALAIVMLSGCDDAPKAEQNTTEHAVDPAGSRKATPTATVETTGPYRLLREVGGGTSADEVELCSLVRKSPEVLDAAAAVVGTVRRTHSDKHACVLGGGPEKQGRVMQIVITDKPDTSLATSFGIVTRGYQYRLGPCLITAAAFVTADGYLAAAAQCDRGVWMAVAAPASQFGADTVTVDQQLDTVLESAITNL